MATTILATYASKSNPTKSHNVCRSADGSHIYCTCPAWTFQRLSPTERTCLHIKSFSAGQLATTTASKQITEKAEVAPILAKSGKRTAARKSAHATHKAMTRGTTEEAITAAKEVANIKGASKNLRALADAVLAAAE